MGIHKSVNKYNIDIIVVGKILIYLNIERSNHCHSILD